MGTFVINITLFIASFGQLLAGCKLTLLIAFCSTFIGMIGGTLIALGQRSHMRLLRFILDCYVAVIRGTPMIVQIVFWYYGLQLPFSPLIVAIIAIGCNSAAYISQVMATGIRTVDKGQLEAAQVMGFTTFQQIRYIILPQALRAVLPSLGNELVTMIKDSSLAYIIGVNELFKESRNLISTTYDVMTIYVAITLLYFIMTHSLTLLIKQAEKQLEKPC